MPDLPTPIEKDTVPFGQPRIVITFPDKGELSHPLREHILRIGRGKENNDIAIPDDYVSISRRHLEIRREGTSYQVVDLASANGVFVNEVRIGTSRELSDGDKIRIGSEEKGQAVYMAVHLGAAGGFQDLEYRTEVDDPFQFSEFHSQPPTSVPHLQIRWLDGSTSYYPIRKDVLSIGRSAECDLKLPESMRFVSKSHAEIRKSENRFTISDLNSTNGTRVNNQQLAPGVRAPLPDGSIIRIGDENFGTSIGMTFSIPSAEQLQIEGYSLTSFEPTVVESQKVLLIGREVDCDIHLPSPQVSRRHAKIHQTGEVYWIEDLGSTNGTFVNNLPVDRQAVQNGDLITIGSHILVYQDGQLSQYQSQGMRLDVSDLSKDVKTRSGPLRILHDINMTVLPREFVAVVGGSGAGKSTLMNALIGSHPGDGQVGLNGHDFYEEYDHFRSQIGYVPQSDILHTSLTVEKALDFAARLRLSTDVSANERSERITNVLETVNMNTEVIRSTRVSKLSGGQRKRVSIAAELLADPKLIYLDEATSGLDPGLEKKLMHILRSMADEGRTVILITHATANIVQTDHVAFLSQGKLVYFGPSQEALDFFEVDDFADIYERIERHGTEWEEIFLHSKPNHHQEYVLKRKESERSLSKRELPKIRFGLRDFFRQFLVLTQRAIRVLMSDWFTMALMLMLFPFTATLQLLISSSNILVGDASIIADPIHAARTLSESYVPFADLNTFIFVMGLEAVLVGMYVPSNELIKERIIYLRERMVNLKVLPYLLSKVAVFTLFAAIQTLLYLIVLSLGVDLPDQGLYFPGPVELFVTLFLTMIAGMGIGFVVSAVSRSSDMAIYVLVIMLFFQFFFAGTVFDMRENAAEPLSYLTTTRWSLTALGVTIDMEEQVEATIICNPLIDAPPSGGNQPRMSNCYNYPDATDDLMLPYDEDKLIQSWGILIGMALVTIVITGILIKRLDAR
jgi:ABC-type multidrug transport system ATPase subunit